MTPIWLLQFPGSGDYDNAPLKPMENQRVRQSADASASMALQSSTVSQGQVSLLLLMRIRFYCLLRPDVGVGRVMCLLYILFLCEYSQSY